MNALKSVFTSGSSAAGPAAVPKATTLVSTGQSSSTTTLSSGWSFTQLSGYNTDRTGALISPATESSVKETSWTPIETVPTSVHVELIKNGTIPDPLKGLNEYSTQWVGEADWRFKTTFKVSKEDRTQPNVDLVFEGLDTFCHVEVNGQKVLYTENMFIAHRVAVKHLLKNDASEENELTLTFPSAWIKGKQLEADELSKKLAANYDPETKEYGKKMAFWNGDSSRLYVRKAQYNYGWDWGPVVMTVGPWKDVKVHAYNSYVDTNRLDVKVDIDVEAEKGYKKASVKSTFKVVSPVVGGVADVVLTNPEGEVIRKQDNVDVSSGEGSVEWDFKAPEIELWWSVGLGKQPLYTVTVTLKDGSAGHVLSDKKDKFGFRHARVVQEPLIDQPGTSFTFEINGRRIFTGGSNWIPADSFLTDISPDRYRAWLDLMIQGNQNMVRVWGGGIYETDVFYEYCDELGLLVWQDFMFGCGQYPAHDELVKNVKKEAEEAVKRLRNHPSVVIFAGNNEDYALCEGLNLFEYSDTSDPRTGRFPARYIYETTLPGVVSELSDIYYQPSSPFGGKASDDKTVGDIHQWNVWHGSQEPWHNWDKLAGRFISEFGMEGYPDIRTVDYWLDGNKSERFPQSRTVCSHNKADGFERRLELYLMENFRHAFDMESYVYYTQAMQAETLAAAYRLWRRNFRGVGKEYTSGALVWQINDCWPTTSWAIVDYFLRPKPAFFAIARELRTFTVGMARKDITIPENEFTAAHYKIEQNLEIWGTNSEYVEKKAKLEVVSFDLESGVEVDRTITDVTLAPNSSTEFWKGLVPGQPARKTLAEFPKVIVVGARLLESTRDAQGNDVILARYSNWPEPWKYIQFPEADLKVVVADDGETVTLSCKRPIKGIILDVENAEGECPKWSDNGIDLMPNDPQTITAKGLDGRKIKARYIGDGTA